jgi:hypothetical protein
LYGSYPTKKNYQNSEYEVHKVGLKTAGSQKFRILAFEGEAAGMTQIGVQRRMTDGFFFCSSHVFSNKKS